MIIRVPFGQTLLLWRTYRGLTQAELARRARMARPNLSAIERGQREVSLGTLRALAAALEIRPGVLVDGVPPAALAQGDRGLSRQALERIADAVVGRVPLPTAGEARTLVEALRQIIRHRTAVAGRPAGRLRRGKRAADAAWLLLEATYTPEVLQSLLQRIADRSLSHEPQTD